MKLSIFKPKRAQVDEVLAGAEGLNYDAKCGTKDLEDASRVKDLKSRGYRICSRKVQVGHGWDDYRKAKSKLKAWEHVKLGWTAVVPDAPPKRGSDFCICARVLGIWITNPLNTVYVENKRTKVPLLNLLPVLPLGYNSARYSFAGGTKKGHLLAGEERFSLSIDRKTKSVDYQISSLSKPDHILSTVGYPLVCLLQSCFIRQSTRSFARKMKKPDE